MAVRILTWLVRDTMRMCDVYLLVLLVQRDVFLLVQRDVFFLFSAMFIFGQRADVAQDAYLCIDLGGLHFAFRDGMTIFTRLGAAVHHRDFRLRCGGGGAPRCLAVTRCGANLRVRTAPFNIFLLLRGRAYHDQGQKLVGEVLRG